MANPMFQPTLVKLDVELGEVVEYELIRLGGSVREIAEEACLQMDHSIIPEHEGECLVSKNLAHRLESGGYELDTLVVEMFQNKFADRFFILLKVLKRNDEEIFNKLIQAIANTLKENPVSAVQLDNSFAILTKFGLATINENGEVKIPKILVHLLEKAGVVSLEA
jgi:hypothetical protein